MVLLWMMIVVSPRFTLLLVVVIVRVTLQLVSTVAAPIIIRANIWGPQRKIAVGSFVGGRAEAGVAFMPQGGICCEPLAERDAPMIFMIIAFIIVN